EPIGAGPAGRHPPSEPTRRSLRMQDLASPPLTTDDPAPPVRLLVADDDPLARSLLASCAREIAGEIVVLEAEDGAEAVQLGLQQRPAVALLDVNMPRLDG